MQAIEPASTAPATRAPRAIPHGVEQDIRLSLCFFAKLHSFLPCACHHQKPVLEQGEAVNFEAKTKMWIICANQKKTPDPNSTFVFRYGNIISLIEIWQPARTGRKQTNKVINKAGTSMAIHPKP
jgi:hypothetical protein